MRNILISMEKLAGNRSLFAVASKEQSGCFAAS
jgi:hypothetical protein